MKKEYAGRGLKVKRSISISEEMNEQVNEIARGLGLPFNQLARDALRDLINKIEEQKKKENKL